MMNDIEPGRYIVLRTRTFFGGIIRWATKSDFDHAVMSLGGGTIAEATPRHGVRIARLSEYAGYKAMANLNEPATQDQLDQAAAAARAQVGTPYNFVGIEELGLEDLGIHWKWLLHLSGADHCLICSAYVCDCGAAARPLLNWLCGRGVPSRVRPSDLAQRPGMVPIHIMRD